MLLTIKSHAEKLALTWLMTDAAEHAPASVHVIRAGATPGPDHVLRAAQVSLIEDDLVDVDRRPAAPDLLGNLVAHRLEPLLGGVDGLAAVEERDEQPLAVDVSTEHHRPLQPGRHVQRPGRRSPPG